VAEGSPADLSRDIDAQVVVLNTDHPRRAGQLLHRASWVLSVAQIGNELRVLVVRRRADAARAVREVVTAGAFEVRSCDLDRASLEDVFVAATLPRQERAAA
jgi:ABC-2 type transport system ATP-binding protein